MSLFKQERALTVGITGINASDNPAPGIGVAKSLKQAGGTEIKVLGLAYDALEPGIYLDRFIDHAFMIPYPAAGHAALVERLCYIKQQVGLDVLIPNLDSEIPVYIRAQEELARHGIHCFLPDRRQLDLRDKSQLAGVAATAGIRAPRQHLLLELSDLERAAMDLGFPLMMKGNLHGAEHCADLGEARAAFHRVAARWGYPVIVQERVNGEEMNVIGVGDGQGEAPGMLAVRKMSTSNLGKIWTGVTVDHPGLMEAAQRFLGFSRWRGPFELECILDGSRVNLIEVNPRFPAWVYFATGVGSNLPLSVVRQALGDGGRDDEPEAPFADSYPSGRLYVRYTDERVCDMGTFQNMVTRGESR